MSGSEKRHIFVEISFVGTQTEALKKHINRFTSNIRPDIDLRFIARPPQFVQTHFFSEGLSADTSSIRHRVFGSMCRLSRNLCEENLTSMRTTHARAWCTETNPTQWPTFESSEETTFHIDFSSRNRSSFLAYQPRLNRTTQSVPLLIYLERLYCKLVPDPHG